MNAFLKSLTAVAVAGVALTSMPAQAVVVTFGGANAQQDNIDVAGVNLINAGKTSAVAGYIDAATNTVTGANVFLETFDALATGNNSFGFPTRPTDSNLAKIQFGGPNGGFNSLNPNTPANGGDLTITNPGGLGMGIQKGTTGFAAAPGGDCVQGPGNVAGCNATYFAYGPGQGGAMPSGVKVSFASLLGAYGPGYGVDYLGVFYGSVDTYNEIRFYDDLGNLISGIGDLSDGILSGTEILDALSLSSGNQIDSNVYVNLGFQPGDQFTSFEFYTTGVAFEIDNVVTHIGRIPEPGSLMLISLGLFGLAGLRRKKA